MTRTLASFQREASQATGFNKRIAMFCTGGIAPRKIDELSDRSVQDVSPGGILKYLEDVPATRAHGT
jgi:predicted sulfurtransferase